jgi:allantoinase
VVFVFVSLSKRNHCLYFRADEDGNDILGSERPATAAGIFPTKGVIAPGSDADFAIFDTSVEFVVSKEDLKFRNKLSPYEGMALRGRVDRTILRGKTVWRAGWNEADLGEPSGRLL